MTRGHCSATLCVVAMILLARIGETHPCTRADVKYVFTPCNPLTNLMESIPYFESLCDQSSGNITLETPASTPCIKPCDSGTFYDPETLGCTPCGKGEFSNSGGEIINTFESFPSRFVAYCNPKPCSPWSVSPGAASLDSGNQSVGTRKSTWWNSADESVESVLTTTVNVINPKGGKIFFQYRVESEKLFDGLQLFFNGQLVKNTDTTASTDRFFATGLHHQWRQAEIPLPVGNTEVRFVYSKDSNQMSDDAKYAGLDRAFLKDFTFEGVQMFAKKCSKCAAGEFADKIGSMDCGVCPKDKYSGAGAPGCTPCQQDEWAPVGSSACTKKVPCTAADYVAVYKSCNKETLKRPRVWKKINTRCLDTATSMPSSGDVDCEICAPGFRLDEDHNCVACPAGSYLDKSSGSCTQCPAGTAAVPILDYHDGFDSFGGAIDTKLFDMSCQGLCSGCAEDKAWCTAPESGFELAQFQAKDDDNTIVGIRQQLSNGNSFTSKLKYSINMVTEGSVTAEYMFVRQGAGTSPVPPGITATFTLNGRETLLDTYFVGPELKGKFIQALPSSGTFDFVFTVSQSGYVAPDDMFAVVLLSLVIEGDSRGGTSRCTPCKSGNYCPGNTNTYLPCPLGTSQYKEGQTSCAACTGDTISKELGSTTCIRCTTGTTVADNHQVCNNNCNVSVGGNHFDFTELRGVVFGPLFPPGERQDLAPDQADLMNIYRFFISPCSLVNHDKSSDKCSQFYGSTVEDAYACQRLNENRSYSLGDDLHFLATSSSQLSMRISGGDMCHRAGRPRSTNITFVCDPSQEGYGTMQYVSEEPQCQYNFLYTSKYGCPVCTAESFVKVESECSAENTRKVAYFKKPSSSQCSGGYVPPATVEYTCMMCQPGFYDMVWSDCIGGQQTSTYTLKSQFVGCYDNGTIGMPKKIQSCTKLDAKIGANGFTVAILFVIACVSILFFALYTLYYRHNRLQVEYQRLSNNTGEMADMDEDEDEGLEVNNRSSVAIEDK